MRQFFYFSSLSIIALVEYDQDRNVFSYSTHRQMKFIERVLIEQYLLYEVAPQTKFYEITPARFEYRGVDKYLAEKVKRAVELQAEMEAADSEKDIDAAVESVVNGAMRDFYFDEICKVLDGKNSLDTQKLSELVGFYNTYADNKITVDALLRKHE